MIHRSYSEHSRRYTIQEPDGGTWQTTCFVPRKDVGSPGIHSQVLTFLLFGSSIISHTEFLADLVSE
jgi:hypothetical protein